MRFVWTWRHTRAGQAHARKDARGGDTQRDNRFIKPHTATTAKHTKGAKRTMSVYTPCALRFYTSSTARGRYTHSRQRGDVTLTRGRGRRERSSASALQHPPTETRPPGEKSSPVANRSQEEHNEGAWGLGYGPVRLKELGLKEAAERSYMS